MTIAEHLTHLHKNIPAHIEIIAVSKTIPVLSIMEAYQAGQRSFGENRVQEMVEKQKALPSDIKWHLIGHLQTNKVKQVVSFVHMIHSVDSLKLLETIEAEAKKINRRIDCLLQIRIAKEETKFGLSFPAVSELLDSAPYNAMDGIHISGVMGIATFTTDMQQVRNEFMSLAKYFDQIKNRWFLNDPGFCVLSMGMSADFQVAIECGSTMVRIGSIIFGTRL
jgi:pyridoxal phosphate enzyme (YggS family)